MFKDWTEKKVKNYFITLLEDIFNCMMKELSQLKHFK